MAKNIVALYMRLSHKDAEISEPDESHSITNQRGILREFIKKNKEFLQSVSKLDSFEVKEFVDDGYSGTNFERPAVKGLLDFARKGQVYCILVKDISRFGRNYIEVGSYLEEIFPSIGVRFISINDAYDSEKQSHSMPGIDMSFKGIIHDYYCKELSKKTKLARRQQVEKGYSIMAKAPYGYLKSNSEKGRLIVDKEAALIVLMIFNLYLNGQSAYQIARILNEKEIPSPNKRLAQKGLITFRNEYSKGLYWGTHTVLAILRNEVYIGNAVGNKCARTKIASKRCKRLDRKQWIVVEGTHEPVVSQAVFYEVQNLLEGKSARGTTRTAREYLFKGKLICGKCHSTMVRSGENKGITYYACNKCRQVSSQNTTIIHSTDLAQLGGQILERNEGTIVEKEKERIDKENSIGIIEELKLFIDEKQKRLPILYERYVDGKLTREQFAEEKERIRRAITEFNNLEREYQTLHDEKRQALLGENEGQELSNKMIARHIEKITVFGRNDFEISWL